MAEPGEALPSGAEPPALAPQEADQPASCEAAGSASGLAGSNLLATSAAAGGSTLLGGGASLAALAGLGLAAGGGGGGGGGGSGTAGGAPSSAMPGMLAPGNSFSARLITNTGLVADIGGGGLTRDNTLGLSGAVASGGQVDVYDGEVFLGSASVSGSDWRFLTPALLDGRHTLRVRYSSVQGDMGFDSVDVDIDTRTSGTLSATVLTDAGATPSITAGGSTLDRTLGLSGTAEAGSRAQIYDGEDLLGSLILAPTSTEWRYTTPALPPGSHVLSAKVIDATGNEFKTETVSLNVLSGFTIDFDDLGHAAQYASTFQRAAAFWSSVITGDLPDYAGVDDLRIRVSIDDIDGDGARGTTAGQTLVTGARPGTLLPYKADLDIDSVLLPTLVADGRLYDLLRHEIGHALGLGVYFQPLGLLDPADPFH